MILLICIPASLAVFWFVWYFAEYRPLKRCCDGKLSFRQFLTLFEVAPLNWDFFSCYVFYTSRFPSPTHANFYFSQVDMVRYWIWRRRRKKKIEARQKTQNVERAIMSFQADIDRYRLENGLTDKEKET